MELDDLKYSEKLALVGLARVMVRLDHDFTEEEATGLAKLIDEFGTEPFWQLIGETRPLDNDAIKKAATEVSRKEVQEMIYGTLYEIATAGSIDPAESDLLEWLEQTWELEVKNVEPDA